MEPKDHSDQPDGISHNQNSEEEKMEIENTIKDQNSLQEELRLEKELMDIASDEDFNEIFPKIKEADEKEASQEKKDK